VAGLCQPAKGGKAPGEGSQQEPTIQTAIITRRSDALCGQRNPLKLSQMSDVASQAHRELAQVLPLQTDFGSDLLVIR